ncbi:MAG: pyruvate dehydrogenase E2 component (dihydrolipoamide acetyltransferase), partial [Sphingobacteriales bacterium]
MAEIITMPKLSDTMTDGVVAEWHKKVGDPVESGEVLAEIETDKATMDFESYSDGVLLHIGVEKGGTAPVDALLAIIGEKGEDITELIKEGAEPSPAAPETPKDSDASAPAPAEKAPAEKAPAPKSNQAAPAPAPAADGSRLKASPLAKKMAT